MEKPLVSLHAIRSLPNMNDKNLRRILLAFGDDPEKAWDSASLPKGTKLSPSVEKDWVNRHAIISDIQEKAAILETEMIRIILHTDSEYPVLLKEIPDHPYFLYVRGTLPHPSQSLLAVVGSRKFTSYGKQACVSLVRDLSRAGVGIVSGLAFGIDKIAHLTALDEGNDTWAVLGSGVDDSGITPTSHLSLGKEITARGALISEYPPGSIPGARNFPERNRIVAGMTLGTLVVEAAEKSGSLITARLALEYNREVFAVPGSIFSSLAQGTNALLKQGAVPATCGEDILKNFPVPDLPKQTIQEKDPGLTELDQMLLTLLSQEMLHIDELVKKTKQSISEISSALIVLEVKKRTKHVGNQFYILQ